MQISSRETFMSFSSEPVSGQADLSVCTTLSDCISQTLYSIWSHVAGTMADCCRSMVMKYTVTPKF
jgi:hypothetical protein